MIKTKVMKNGLGEWGIWWTTDTSAQGKCTHIAYKRFFKTKEVAEKWQAKFIKKMLKK